MNYLKKALQYIRSTFQAEDDFLKNLKIKTSLEDFPIQINEEEGLLLEFLIKSSNIKTIVELGTLAGYSTIWMARALPSNGKIYTIERSENRFKMAQNTFSDLKKTEPETVKKIHSIKGDALDVLNKLEESFDMIFIDADKISYLKYLNWAEKNIKKFGIIVADNTFLFGCVFEDYETEKKVSKTTLENIKIFNKTLANRKKYTTFMMPSYDGITVAYKKFCNYSAIKSGSSPSNKECRA